ncbi:MAG: hypothetical protein ABSD38_15805 [Syntrophorhabdales bacterium]|jgi:hypothetical protein
MTISDYQVSSVVRTYMKNMSGKVGQTGKVAGDDGPEDQVLISDGAMKKMLFERIGEKMTERLRKHDQEE